MSITIKATKTTLTPAIRTQIENKLSVLDRFLRPEHKLHVEIEVNTKHKSGLVNRIEIDIQPEGFYAEARGNDFYEALDLAIPKIKEQLVKVKDKKITLRKKGRR